MKDKNNEETFFFTAANFKEAGERSLKSLSLCYVFSYERGTRFYNAPGIFLKIKTETGYDTTECKGFIQPDKIGSFVQFLKDSYNMTGTQPMKFISGKFNIDIFIKPNSNTHVIKITNSDGYSNDIAIDKPSLAYIIKSCDSMIANMIPVTMQFMQLVKAEESQNVLNDIRSMMASMKSVICKSNKKEAPSFKIPVAPVTERTFDPVVPVKENVPAPVTEEEPQQNNESWADVYANSSQSPADEMTETAFDTDMGDVDIGISNADANVIKPSVENTAEVKASNEALSRIINEAVSKNPIDKMAEIISSTISDAYDKKIRVSELFDTTLARTEIPMVDSGLALCYFTDMNYAIFERYIAKLAYITEHSNMFSSKVPIFTLPVSDLKRYDKAVSLLGRTLVKMYEDTKDRVTKASASGKPVDERLMFAYSCLRFLFAPVWSSYVRATNDDLSPIMQKIRGLVTATLQKYNGDVDKSCDNFLATNNVTYQSQDDKLKNPIYRLFTTVCPAMNMALNMKAIANPDALKILAKYIDALSMDTSIEETTIPPDFLPSLYTKECLGIFRSLSKVYNVTSNTTYEELTNIYNRVMSDGENNLEFMNGLCIMDRNSKFMDEETVPF
jgi:hypothetical protein